MLSWNVLVESLFPLSVRHQWIARLTQNLLVSPKAELAELRLGHRFGIGREVPAIMFHAVILGVPAVSGGLADFDPRAGFVSGPLKIWGTTKVSASTGDRPMGAASPRRAGPASTSSSG